MLAAEQRTYQRHRPEQTLLYQLVEKHYPAFAEMMQFQGKPLPYHVFKEFEEFLKCGRLEHGFLRVVCDYWQLMQSATTHRITAYHAD
ncbi:uncharacterized protein METZ01_LOCUS276317 [marine metagenome]|uniref:Uncharacterized protein n=1 Tax=marine metagenome TaxID=408172 RepID=A0A382KJ78_9ZZZZ|tara:strand:+ start:3733 stop:3996 length:264 start_codon:yes stop_codon:yes gene_type:complete